MALGGAGEDLHDPFRLVAPQSGAHDDPPHSVHEQPEGRAPLPHGFLVEHHAEVVEGRLAHTQLELAELLEVAGDAVGELRHVVLPHLRLRRVELERSRRLQVRRDDRAGTVDAGVVRGRGNTRGPGRPARQPFRIGHSEFSVLRLGASLGRASCGSSAPGVHESGPSWRGAGNDTQAGLLGHVTGG